MKEILYTFLAPRRDKMIRIPVLCSLLAMSCVVSAQHAVPSREEILSFFTTKTLVVLEDNPLNEYNRVIREVMQQEWSVTGYDFITFKEFEEKRSDPDYSFLYPSKVTFENDKTDAAYRFIHLSLGGDYFRLAEMPDMASVPLSYHNVEEDAYLYKLGVLIRFIQQHVLLIRENPEIVSSNVLEYYNSNIRKISGKTLYLVADELVPDMRTEAAIRKIYPFPFRFVTPDEIRQAASRKDPDVVFLHKVGPEKGGMNARCYKVIIGASDATFYYFDYHMISDRNPNGFLAADFKKLVR